MKFNVEDITALVGQISPWVALGTAGVKLVLSVVDELEKINARGRPPTQEELHEIALAGRAAFEALPKP